MYVSTSCVTERGRREAKESGACCLVMIQACDEFDVNGDGLYIHRLARAMAAAIEDIAFFKQIKN